MTNKQKAILWTITMPLWIAPAILIVVPFWLTYETVLNLLDDGSTPPLKSRRATSNCCTPRADLSLARARGIKNEN